MSSEAMIYIETGDGRFPKELIRLPSHMDVEYTPERESGAEHSEIVFIPEDAQFQIDTIERFYAKKNQPLFYGLLLSLLYSPNVSRVWFGPDDKPHEIEEITDDEILRVIREFLEDSEKYEKQAERKD